MAARKSKPAAPPPPTKVLSPEDQAHVARWRLVLGKVAEQQGLTLGNDPQAQAAQKAIDFVFDDSSFG